MSSSLGRIALGVVGALILAPIGGAAIGFAIGSAIGGFIFAPEGPSVEGPRLGDTDVSSSTVGKIIPKHYGTTRASGNVIWSAGLKEIKTEEENDSGGKGGGGGGGTTTSYSYFASFAIVFGRGRAETVIRMWADGKLIYDATGSGDVKNGKYNFRLRRGVADPSDRGTVDPLIAESVNRRLQGLPDVNAGNQPQSSFKTMNALITEVASLGTARGNLYAAYLTLLRNQAVAGGGTPRNYRFTPSYKEVTYMVFDDMPLEDFGNRIPNITAELVWSTSNVLNPNDTVVELAVGEISASTGIPPDMMGIDPNSRSALVISNNTRLRRFSLSSGSESVDRSIVLGTGINAEKVLCVATSGDWIVRGSRPAGTDRLYKLDNVSLTPKNTDVAEMSQASRTATFGCNAGINGATDVIAVCNPGGDFGIADAGGGQIKDIGQSIALGLGDGPMVYGGGEPGDTRVFWVSQNGTNFRVHKIDLRFPTSSVELFAGALTGLTAFSAGVTLTNTLMDTARGLAGGAVAGIIYNFQQGRVYVIIRNAGGGGTIYEYDPDESGTDFLVAIRTFTGTPPNIDSGLSRSNVSFGQLVFANGNDVYSVDLSTGNQTVYTDVLSANAAASAQIYDANSSQLFTWVGVAPTLIRLNSLVGGLFQNDLASVVSDVCQEVGMLPDEYDVSAIAGLYNVRGYTIGRPTDGRKVLEKLFQAYFVDGIESDWTIKFQPQSSTAIRIIQENELGKVQSPTGDVAFLESRVPEQDLPSEVSIIFTDPDRDYQQGSGHYKRVSQPVPTMYSKKLENIELPLVFTEAEGRSIAERVLFLAWMSREQGKSLLPWTHIDMDPADVVEFRFNDGRILTERLINMQIGADFNIETQSVRAGDPVFVAAPFVNVATSNVPTNGIQTPSFSKMFVLDMPLLYDYHDLNRIATRYYAAVGSDTTTFSSADLFQSLDGAAYSNFDSIGVDCTWGTITSGALGAPRSLHSTDEENTFTVKLSVDNGDLVSVSDNDIATGLANRALIINTTTGDIEILQFKNVTSNIDGTYTFDTLVRGRRGTDYAVDKHEEGEVFIYVTDAAVVPQTNDLGSIGTTRYFKAVSRGGLLATSPPVGELFEGRDLKPYAPNYVRRSDDTTDLTVDWNRRTRVGGQWNMIGTGIEDVPINEDFEQYEFYLLPNTPTALDDFNPLNAGTYISRQQVAVPQAVVTGLELTGNGYTLADDINVAVFQLSAQVGRGFGRVVSLAP